MENKMTNICANCKYKTLALTFDSNFKPIAMYCKKEKTWIYYPLNGCDKFEPNLHDHNAAPKYTQARDNGIHQE